MSIRIYLKENEDNILDFPVTPSEISVNNTSEIATDKINALGQISIFSGKNLRSTQISSFFPVSYDTFCNYKDIKKPYEYVETLQKWLDEGTKLRLIVADMNTNFQVMISSLSFKEMPGNGDVYFDISLIEYVEIKTSSSNANNNNTENNTDRPTENKPTTPIKTHKVVKGDTLWDIARKYYGKGSDYPKIKEKNKSKYPSLSKNNYIYVGWELEL